MGKAPAILEIKNDTDLSKIQAPAAAASQTPTIASQDTAKKATGFHGFTVLGLSGSTIALYDPEQAKKLTVSLADFRSNFKALLSGNP